MTGSAVMHIMSLSPCYKHQIILHFSILSRLLSVLVFKATHLSYCTAVGCSIYYKISYRTVTVRGTCTILHCAYHIWNKYSTVMVSNIQGPSIFNRLLSFLGLIQCKGLWTSMMKVASNPGIKLNIQLPSLVLYSSSLHSTIVLPEEHSMLKSHNNSAILSIESEQ